MKNINMEQRCLEFLSVEYNAFIALLIQSDLVEAQSNK